MPINNMFSTGFNTGFGSGFSIGGNNIQSITKQQKYPGLNAEQVKRLEASVNGLTGTAKTQQLQKNYRAMIQIINDQNINDNRTAVNNERFKNSLNKKDARECRFDQSACRQSDLVDLVKSVKGLKASTDENTVMTKLMQEMSIRGVEMDSLNNYLDKGDETFLYEMGLAQQPQQSNALSIKGTVADNEGGEWNDNLFGRFETDQYDKNASLGENALTFGKNLLKSGVNVLSDVGNMIVNPLDTANALGKTAVGGVANLLGVDEDMAQWGDRFNSANDTADQVGQFFSDRYGGGEQILNTLFTDPVGVISDAATLISGGAGAVKGITTGAAKATAKAGLKGTTRALERTSNTAGKIAKAGLEYDPYSVAMKLEMKPISATIDYAKKVPGASKIMKEKLNEALDKTVGLDKLTKKAIQDNPFSKEVWQKAKTWIDANGLPEKSTEVSKQLITDVSEKVQNAVAKEMEKLGDTGPMYQPLKEAGFSVDLTNLKNGGLDEILTDYGIKIEDGKLDFSKSAIDGSEASNIKKIYDRVQDTNSPMPMNEYIDRFRKTISDMVNFNTNNRNALGKKLADTPGDKVLKSIRERANELAHEQVPALKDLDSAFTKQSELVKEITEGIVYKDKAKMGVVRDNIDQIVKNLDTNNRAQLKARLEKIIPGIEQEVKAINMLPKLIDNYYRPSKLQQKISGTAGAIIGTTVGGIPGGLLGAGAGYWLSNKIDKLKSRKRDKIISETSKDGADKLADIQNRIANNEKISQAQKAFLKEISQKLKEGKQVKEGEVMRIISDIMSAEEGKELAVLDKAISELETLGAKDEVKEWKKFREDMIGKMDEEAEMNRYAEEFEAEKQNIINESADQRLPEFKRRIYQLGQEERRIGSVAGKKIGKNFEGKDYHKQQQTEWLRKKEAVIKEIQDYYNVDQFEASEIYDRIERQASADDLGFSKSQASSKTAKYQVADEQGVGKQYKQYTIDGKERADYGELNRVNKLFDREQTLDGLKHDIILSKERGNDIGGDLFIQRKVASDGIKRIEESIETGKGYWVGGDDFITDKSVLNKLLDEKKKIIDYIDNFDESTLKEYNGLGLSEEKISQQINSKGFKDFIGDSIAKNTDGTPKDLYHGTTDGGFTIFDINRSGKNANKLGPGIYLSNEPKVAREYTKHMNQETGKLYKEDYDTPEIMKVYARLENPLRIDKELIDLDAVKKVLKEGTKEYFFDNEIPFFLNGKIELTKDQIKALPKDKRVDLYVDYLSKGNDIQDVNKELLNQVSRAYRDNLEQGLQNLSKATGKDGVFFEKGGSEQYVLWDNSQVKSATDNIGTFDKNNPDIRFQKYGTAGRNEKGMTATEGLNIRNFKNGKTVQELANQYGIDTKIVDSISTPEGQRAYGMYGDRLITLSKDLKESTVPHELLHGVFDIVDSKRRTSILEGIQKKLNVDNVQAEEWLADNFSEYYRTGKFGTQGLAKGLVEKVKQFFYQVKSYIDGTYKNEKQIRQLFDDIIDGKIEGEYGVYSDPKFQSVWHGSPYEFEKFDSANMGKGEGAQAHGWGHYVAAEEKTGRHYAEMGNNRLEYKGLDNEALTKEYYDLNKKGEYTNRMGEIAAAKAIFGEMGGGMSFSEAKKTIKDRLEKWTKDSNNGLWKKELEEIDNIKDGDIVVRQGRNLYEVEIPDPIKKDTPTGSNYWEERDSNYTKEQIEKIGKELAKKIEGKPLEQATMKDVENIAKAMHNKLSPDAQKMFVENVKEWVDKGHDIKTAIEDNMVYYTSLSSTADGWLEAAGLRPQGKYYDAIQLWRQGSQGRNIYTKISSILGGDKEASKFLESLGYDGIHYFGGTDGEAYVIFNDDALEITKHHKY